jgi:hypothetical protein
MNEEVFLEHFHLAGAEVFGHCGEVSPESPHGILALEEEPFQPFALGFPPEKPEFEDGVGGKLESKACLTYPWRAADYAWRAFFKVAVGKNEVFRVVFPSNDLGGSKEGKLASIWSVRGVLRALPEVCAFAFLASLCFESSCHS